MSLLDTLPAPLLGHTGRANLATARIRAGRLWPLRHRTRTSPKACATPQVSTIRSETPIAVWLPFAIALEPAEKDRN